MICPTCNKPFEPRAVNQIYCCRDCERTASRQRYYNRDSKPDQPNKIPIAKFTCKNCGKTVFIYDRNDQRSVYCSGMCSAAYQKKRVAQKTSQSTRQSRCIRRYEFEWLDSP